MITLPFTQMHLFLSMIITEVFLVSDPNYTVRIGTETYFSLAVGAFVGIVFLFGFMAIRFGSKIQFKEHVPKIDIVSEHERRKQVQLIKVVAK